MVFKKEITLKLYVCLKCSVFSKKHMYYSLLQRSNSKNLQKRIKIFHYKVNGY